MSTPGTPSRTMIDRGIGSIIVTERGRPLGIATERDLVKRVVSPCKDPNQTKIKEIISPPLITTSKETVILNAMRKMRDHNISRLVVMDDGALMGIISERDIIRVVTISSITFFSTLVRKRRQRSRVYSLSNSGRGKMADTYGLLHHAEITRNHRESNTSCYSY